MKTNKSVYPSNNNNGDQTMSKFNFIKASALIKKAPIKLLLYGDSGAGKTTLAVTAPKPLVLLTEMNGIPSINASNPDACVIHCSTIQDIRDVVAGIRDGVKELSQFETLVIDSLTETQRLILDDILAKSRRDTMQLQDYGKLADATRGLIRVLRDLPINVVCTALNDVDNEEATGKRHYQPIFIGKKTGKEISQWFTCVGYLYRKDTKEGDARVAQRHVMFDGVSSVLCKSAQPIESIITDPNLTKIINQIQNHNNKGK